MHHIKSGRSRAEATPAEWLGLGAQLGEVANDWARRSDIIAYVGPGAGGPAPACFNPSTAEMEINLDVAFGRVSSVPDFRERSTQFEFPRAAGAVFHEAMHARYSTWDLAAAAAELESEPRVLSAMHLLEEGRIEALGVSTVPSNRYFLKACALDIVLSDLDDDSLNATASCAGNLAGLVLARVEADVLDIEDVEPVAEFITDVLGEERVERLMDVARRAQAHRDHGNYAPMVELAREWLAILDEAREERGESEDEPAGEPGPGGAGGWIRSILEDAAAETGISVVTDLSDQEESEAWAEEVASRGLAAAESREHQRKAEQVFSKGTGPSADRRTHSTVRERRAPTAAERAAAVQIARMLDRAKYRDRDATRVTQITPPGRMRPRAVVQNAAARAQGRPALAEPFRRTVRRQVDDPTLTVGIMVDISGSMSSAMEPMAVTAWAMAEAAYRVQGRAAMVYYGSGVFPTLKPGQRLDQVTVYTAPDGTEKFDDAFKALNGSLDLLSGSGARLLVVVSDGCYTGDELRAAKAWVARCAAAGVGVLWLPFDDGSYARSIAEGTAQIVTGVGDPAQAALVIGQAAERALTAAGR